MKWLKTYETFRPLNYPIGVFDSGYGGLTILNRLKNDYPDWNIIYLGDNLTAPYGNMSDSEVVLNTKKCLDFLNSKGCKKIILACNTASSKSELINNDTIDIISPTKEFIKNSSSNIGLVATKSTVNSEVYNSSNVTQLACPDWVRIVEEANFSNESVNIIKSDLEKLFELNSEIETIILACTHFNVLKNIINRIIPSIEIISQDSLLSNYLKTIKMSPSYGGQVEYYTTGDSHEFSTETMNIFGESILAKSISLTNI
jgi:glutamate racemase